MNYVNMDIDELINRLISHMPETVETVNVEAGERALDAHLLLEEHRHSGDATIELKRASVRSPDAVVILSDARGLGAAMAMEFGRKPGTTSSWGPMNPLSILNRAIFGRGGQRFGPKRRSL